ncbi:hypothetical protein LF41_2705 [Lysobacter dokdonensis DS-58]|uniref:DUF4279 domain-containing protein n=1 Tax=Lysobacter dokdonensis DS-58 TaxID=1300345 RepID=A0A0A2WMD6_9GAMM|nr:hypothetical protein [Lysobacter dokdonensis]KGQ19450.1 hypothetical protein LF41_2705 [Lysobacter dokdonensis DS-58]
MSDKRYTISLRTTHPTKSAKWMEEAIGQVARRSRSVGEIRIAPGGRALDVNRESCCDFNVLPVQRGAFTFGVASAAVMLSHHERAFARIREEGGVAELFVRVFIDDASNTAFALEPALMSRLVTLGLRLSLDVSLEERQ